MCQLGGTYGGTFNDQWTYTTQLTAAQNMGLRAYTYIWYGVGGSSQLGQIELDYCLPKVQTPKGYNEFHNFLWMATYPDYQVHNQPYYGIFLTMDGVALYQFNSNYVSVGLDGHVDLLNITQNCDSKHPQLPNSPQNSVPPINNK